MGWLVTGRDFEARLRAFEAQIVGMYNREVSRIVLETKAHVERIEREYEREHSRLARKYREFRNKVRAELTLVTERSEQTTGRLFELEGKIAAIEATHHKVGYVPVDAFKALSEGDVEKAVGISEQVRDNLKEIVALQDELAAAGNPSSSGAEWL